MSADLQIRGSIPVSSNGHAGKANYTVDQKISENGSLDGSIHFFQVPHEPFPRTNSTWWKAYVSKTPTQSALCSLGQDYSWGDWGTRINAR